MVIVGEAAEHDVVAHSFELFTCLIRISCDGINNHLNMCSVFHARYPFGFIVNT